MLETNAKYKKRGRKADVRLRNAKSHFRKPLYGIKMALYQEKMPLYGAGTQKTAEKRDCTLYIGIPRRYGVIRYGFT